MRPLIIKDKYIGKSNIESFKDFVVEDSYLIKEEDEGFKVEGKVNIRGNLKYLDDEEEVFKEIKVDLLIPYDKLESRNMIKLVLDKVDFSKNENILLIKVKIKVIGDEEVKEKFMFENRKMEYEPVSEEVTLDKDFMKSIEDLMKSNKEEVDVVTTIKEEKENIDVFDFRVSEEKEDEPLPIVEDEIKEIPKKEELLKSDYVVTFLFYRVKENETLNDILNKFNMSKEDFYKLNKNKEVKVNDLVQVKIK